jgi:hypothetical protein
MQPGEFLLSISVAALYTNAVRARVTADLPSLPSSRLLPCCSDIDEGDGATGSEIFCPYRKLTNWYDNYESDLSWPSFATLPTDRYWGVNAALPYCGCILIPLLPVGGRWLVVGGWWSVVGGRWLVVGWK